MGEAVRRNECVYATTGQVAAYDGKGFSSKKGVKAKRRSLRSACRGGWLAVGLHREAEYVTEPVGVDGGLNRSRRSACTSAREGMVADSGPERPAYAGGLSNGKGKDRAVGAASFQVRRLKRPSPDVEKSAPNRFELIVRTHSYFTGDQSGRSRRASLPSTSSASPAKTTR